MATRLYLRDTTDNTAGFAATELSTALPVGTANASGAAAQDLKEAIGASAVSQNLASLAQTADQDGFFRKFISVPLAGVDITAQTWTLAIAAVESNGSANAFIQKSLYVLQSDDTVRGYIFDVHNVTGPGGEFFSALRGKVITLAGSAVTGVVSTDRLVLEVWYHASQAMAVSYTNTIGYNGATAIADGVDNSDPASYIETPQDGIFANVQTIPVGVASEIETAKTVTVGASTVVTVGVATETETAGAVVPPLTTFPIRQQISHFLTGTSISGELRVAPLEDNMVFALVSAATALANLTGPSGYTKAAEEEGDGISIQLWYKRAGAGESTTVTLASSVSVALKIHVFESPGEMFVTGDPLDVVATNDSSTSAVTTLSAGTTAAVSQSNTFAVAAVAALGGNIDFALVNWSDGFTALSDYETLGLMAAYKPMTAIEAATATATWNQATSPTSHKAAGLVATFSMAVELVLPDPSPRRVAFDNFRDDRNTTGTVPLVAEFQIIADRLYLAFVATSKTGGSDTDSSIADSHGAAVSWTLRSSHSIGASRRVHVFEAMHGSDLTADSLTVTTPNTNCTVWCLVVDVTAGAIRQVAVGDEPTTTETFLELSFASTPLSTSAVVGLALHGVAERQLIDASPIHTLFAEAQMAGAGQQATVDWYQGSDQTFRWDWATPIHCIAIIAEIQVPTDAQSISVGVASETETAKAVAAVATISVVVGAASETETAKTVAAVPGTVTIAVGVATETETAKVVTADVGGGPQSITVGTASETETANAVTADATISVTVGAAAEVETAQTVTVQTEVSIAVGTASEVEAAQAVTVQTVITINVGAAAETETAQTVSPVAGAVTIAVGTATETETARSVTVVEDEATQFQWVAGHPIGRWATAALRTRTATDPPRNRTSAARPRQ